MTPAEKFAEAMRIQPKWGEEGEDLEARHQRVGALLAEAAGAGHLPAIEWLAEGSDPEHSFDWAIVLARMGDARELTTALTNGDFPVERCTEVFAAARAGEPWAMVAVGAVYGSGSVNMATGKPMATEPNAWGWAPAVEDPDAEATRWYTHAADAGWAAGALYLASDLRYTDPSAALGWIRRALVADAVLTERQRKAASKMFVDLLERTDAPIEAQIAAFTALAESGDPDAFAWLGDRHRLGEGVTKDPERAREYYERAAAAGSVAGMRELAKMLEKGSGGAKDPDRARQLYEQAAELGNDAYARDRLAKKFGLQWYARARGERGGDR